MSRTVATRICLVIVALYAAILVVRTGPMQAWPGLGTEVARPTDFVSLWTAGKLALEGQPLAAYDWTRQRSEFEALTAKPLPGSYFLPFPYPPTFLAVMALFAMLGYGLAHLVWTVATTGAYAAAAARIAGSREGAIWMLAPVAVIFNADVGQTGALSATLLGLGLYLIPSRPVLAGVLLGLLSYKPHLGVLLPLALAAAGYWRTFVSAAFSSIAMALAATLLFGLDAWPAFLAQLGNMGAQIQNGANTWKLMSLFGVLRTLGVPAQAALVAHALFAIAVAGLVTLAWYRRDVPFDAKAAVLGAGALLMSPYLFIYDMSVLMVAQAFLLRAAFIGQADRVELGAIVAANVLVLLSPVLGLPLGFVASVAILGLAMRRAAVGCGRRRPYRTANPSDSATEPQAQRAATVRYG